MLPLPARRPCEEIARPKPPALSEAPEPLRSLRTTRFHVDGRDCSVSRPTDHHMQRR
jgi:hypothetical protein